MLAPVPPSSLLGYVPDPSTLPGNLNFDLTRVLSVQLRNAQWYLQYPPQQSHDTSRSRSYLTHRLLAISTRSTRSLEVKSRTLRAARSSGSYTGTRNAVRQLCRSSRASSRPIIEVLLRLTARNGYERARVRGKTGPLTRSAIPSCASFPNSSWRTKRITDLHLSLKNKEEGFY